MKNVYVPWVPHTAHKLLTPGHWSGDPWPPGRETPPTRAVTGKICLCLCAFSFSEQQPVGIERAIPVTNYMYSDVPFPGTLQNTRGHDFFFTNPLESKGLDSMFVKEPLLHTKRTLTTVSHLPHTSCNLPVLTRPGNIHPR